MENGWIFLDKVALFSGSLDLGARRDLQRGNKRSCVLLIANSQALEDKVSIVLKLQCPEEKASA